MRASENITSCAKVFSVLSMLTLVERLSPQENISCSWTLLLEAEERTRSRGQFLTIEGKKVQLFLPRGTVLKNGDLLRDEGKEVYVRVNAKDEPVMTVTSADPLFLARAAYHLGNRHVPVEIGEGILRFKPDNVLADMLRQMGFQILEENEQFHPEAGGYKYPHVHGH